MLIKWTTQNILLCLNVQHNFFDYQCQAMPRMNSPVGRQEKGIVCYYIYYTNTISYLLYLVSQHQKHHQIFPQLERIPITSQQMYMIMTRDIKSGNRKTIQKSQLSWREVQKHPCPKILVPSIHPKISAPKTHIQHDMQTSQGRFQAGYTDNLHMEFTITNWIKENKLLITTEYPNCQPATILDK